MTPRHVRTVETPDGPIRVGVVQATLSSWWCAQVGRDPVTGHRRYYRIGSFMKEIREPPTASGPAQGRTA